ncbi:MAG: radical SAM family heme chaperone HemW, partial [Gammaproteobacteria bacterium]
RQCRHNLNYWRYGDYLGIGAGAHGKLTVDGAVVRTEKARSPREYLLGRGIAAAVRRQVPTAELPFEYMLNALRLNEGFSLAEFERCTRLDEAVIRPALAGLESRGLLDRDGDRLRPSVLGFRFLNDLQSAFLPA